MTDIGRLTVSLTKHNAHKVARLLKTYDSSEVLSHLDEVHAEVAQTRKNLSVGAGSVLPSLWREVQVLGSDAIDALLLIAIIFSHRDLIQAMIGATDRQGFVGRVDRGVQLGGKAYTNFVRIVDQLGYATQIEHQGIVFNLKGMFEIPGLGPLAGELLKLKLQRAKWDGSNDPIAELIRLHLHEVFGISPSELTGWLRSGAQPTAAEPTLSAKDREFFEERTEGETGSPFEFRAGHEERDVDPVPVSGSAKSEANRLHNEIQNRLYAFLRRELGASCVGTELDTGSGTFVDVATKQDGKLTFYEIKTARTVRTSIRQAIPQLLEYAFWPPDQRADELVIVSHLPITPDGDGYLSILRKRFQLPILYRQFDLEKDVLL